VTVLVPLISIVIATLNRADLLARCLRSIQLQKPISGQEFEVIVADGGSIDATVHVIKQYTDVVTLWWSRPDAGVYDAWNASITAARGEWILFLGSDDVLTTPSCLAEASAILARVEHAAFVAFPIQVVGREGQVQRRHVNPLEALRRGTQGLMPFPHPGTFHRRSVLVDLGGFDMHLKIAGDLDLAVRGIHRGIECPIGPVLVVMASGGLSTSPRFIRIKLRETALVRRRHRVRASMASSAADAIEVLRLVKYWIVRWRRGDRS
jgi:glycosyltransferase involved in cell wall biosynthesis